MAKNSLYIACKKSITERILRLLTGQRSKLDFQLNRDLKLIHRDDRVWIPIDAQAPEENSRNILNELTKQLMQDKIKQNDQIGNIEIISKVLEHDDYYNKKPRDLHEALLQKIPEYLLEFVPKSYDIIGDIVITEIDRWGELSKSENTEYQNSEISAEKLKEIVGNTILDLNKNVMVVLNKKSDIQGEFRTRQFENIGGEKRFTTIYKENGYEFALDIKKVFFTPRLVFERKRISNLSLKEKEVVLDCFAGIGPYSIQIAGENFVNIYSCEKNPEAYKYLKENITLNHKKLKGKITPYLGDFRDFHKIDAANTALNNTALIIMNLPEKNLEFLPYLTHYVRPRGTVLIIYIFAPEPNPLDKAEKMLMNELQNTSLFISEIRSKRIVKNFAPKVYTVAIDVEIKKE